MYVCMYLMIGKGQIAQRDHIGAKMHRFSKNAPHTPRSKMTESVQM